MAAGEAAAVKAAGLGCGCHEKKRWVSGGGGKVGLENGGHEHGHRDVIREVRRDGVDGQREGAGGTGLYGRGGGGGGAGQSRLEREMHGAVVTPTWLAARALFSSLALSTKPTTDYPFYVAKSGSSSNTQVSTIIWARA